jgi:hypothetical protein
MPRRNELRVWLSGSTQGERHVTELAESGRPGHGFGLCGLKLVRND